MNMHLGIRVCIWVLACRQGFACCMAGCTQKLLSCGGKEKTAKNILPPNEELSCMNGADFFYQNSHIHSMLVIMLSRLQSRGCKLWFSPLAEFLLFLFSVCLFYLVSPCVSHRALKSASIFYRNCALFYTHPHPNTYTRNVKGVFEIKPCVSSGLKYLLTWRHVLKFFLSGNSNLILLVLHLKIWVLDFSKGGWFLFPFLTESSAQFEMLERGQKFATL